MEKNFLFFCFFLFITQNQAQSANLIGREIKDIVNSEKKIEILRKKINQKSLKGSNFRISQENRAYSLESIKIENNDLVIEIFCYHKDVTLEKRFPFKKILESDVDEYSVNLDAENIIYFKNSNDFNFFLETIQELTFLSAFQGFCFSKIIQGSYAKSIKSYNIPEKTFNKLTPSQKITFKKAKQAFLLKKIRSVLSSYAKKYDSYNTKKKRRGSDESFDLLARKFFSLVEEDYSLLNYVNFEILIDFLKQVGYQSCHLKDISDSYNSILIEQRRTILKLLKEKSLENGKKIKSLSFNMENYDTKEVFRILRVENDFMWLSLAVIELEKSLYPINDGEMTETLSPDLYNFRECIKIAQFHVFLLVNLLKKGDPRNWKQILGDSLCEEKCIENLKKKMDFSSPYGRWAQSGEAIEGFLAIEKSLVKGTVSFELYQRAKNKCENFFTSNHTYLDIIEELTLPLRPSFFSALKVLSIIKFKDLSYFLEEEEMKKLKYNEDSLLII